MTLGSAAALLINVGTSAQQSTDDNAARRTFSGSEYTTTLGSPTNASEVLVDVKAPGSYVGTDAHTYYAGTLDLQDTVTNPPTFDNASIRHAISSWPGINISGFKQVASVHCRNADQSIAWQRYFYGSSSNGQVRWTNARAISVWPAASEADTRVAICGETTEMVLPESQLSASLGSATATDPTGFVAVFDGSGNLLWSYQFYGSDFSQRCAITDLSIRVEQVGTSSYDVVTYCGISSHGKLVDGSPLAALLPYDPPTGQPVSYTAGGGDADTGGGNWDGIVGRLRRSHAGGNASRDFHSIVGGTGLDGLFGIAEMGPDNFAVVGHTRKNVGASLRIAYPFTASSVDWNNVEKYEVGTLMAFDASPTRLATPDRLVLQASHPMGGVGEMGSIARDITAAATQEGTYLVWLVGSTNHWVDESDNFLLSCPGMAWPTSDSPTYHGGSRDGWLVFADIDPLATGEPVNFLAGAFVGGEGVDDLTGVAMWNEGTAYCVVFGTTDSMTSGGMDFMVSSWSNVSSTGTYLGKAREDVIGSSASEFAAPMGPQHATALAPLTYVSQVGLPSGGGVSMDSRERVSLVGASNHASATTQYPVVGGSSPRGGMDGLRTMCDMLPKGVWRTDGTGTSNTSTAVFQPGTHNGVTVYGGTTPSTCIAPFGHLVGSSPADVQRMHIDYLGSAPAQGVTDAAIHFLAAPPPNLIVGALIQYGFPGMPSTVAGSSVELWTPSNAVTLSLGVYANGTCAVFPGGMPSGSNEFTVQVIMLLSTTLPCDSGATLSLAASPGIVFGY